MYSGALQVWIFILYCIYHSYTSWYLYIDQNCMKWSALYSIITIALKSILYPCNQQVKSWNHMSLIKEYICTFSSLKFNCVILQRDYIYIVNRFIFVCCDLILWSLSLLTQELLTGRIQLEHENALADFVHSSSLLLVTRNIIEHPR